MSSRLAAAVVCLHPITMNLHLAMASRGDCLYELRVVGARVGWWCCQAVPGWVSAVPPTLTEEAGLGASRRGGACDEGRRARGRSQGERGDHQRNDDPRNSFAAADWRANVPSASATCPHPVTTLPTGSPAVRRAISMKGRRRCVSSCRVRRNAPSFSSSLPSTSAGSSSPQWSELPDPGNTGQAWRARSQTVMT